ncbi:ATP-binding cassette domain-containing protein, partial [Reyranella sp.]|uniref:ABC transporter ATP-binding protein n=1 Tax=Reyranella sp. TaxID=1929291 RepID=UPI0025F82FF1
MAPLFLEIEGLACRRGGRRVFSSLSFGLAAGELLALTGRNGSGKTTLLRALAGLVRPDAGTVRWQGADVARDIDAWHGRLAWLGHLDGLKGDLTVAENLVVAQRLRGQRPEIEGQEGSLQAIGAPAAQALGDHEIFRHRQVALEPVEMTE